jgi:hypothetical protein
MDGNRWEPAIRCLEIAVHPATRDDAMVAAVNTFRRAAEGLPLSQICIEFACGGVPLTELARFKDTIERLNRENRELRRKLAVEEVAQSSTARRLDDAHRRIFELTEEAMAAQRLAEVAEQDFEEFRAAYAEALEIPSSARGRGPFNAFLTEAKLAAGEAAAFNSGSGSGRLRLVAPGEAWATEVEVEENISLKSAV